MYVCVNIRLVKGVGYISIMFKDHTIEGEVDYQDGRPVGKRAVGLSYEQFSSYKVS